MNTKQAMARLEELGDEKRRAFNAKRGAGDNQFGVKTGDIRKLAKEIKVDHDLGALLDRIEKETPKAAPQAQWTMNACLVMA